jgi:hypothetical protein
MTLKNITAQLKLVHRPPRKGDIVHSAFYKEYWIYDGSAAMKKEKLKVYEIVDVAETESELPEIITRKNRKP